MPGYQVDPQAVRQAGVRVARMAQRGADARRHATAAAVPERAWGLLGELTTRGKYQQLQQQLVDHTGRLAGGIDALGGKLAATADAYLAQELRARDSFEALR